MPFYELITEPGSHSVAYYENDDEAVQAVKAHHQRAINGEAGGPTGHSAERIVKVLKYEKHPAEFGAEQLVPISQAQTLLEESARNGLVDVNKVHAALRSQIDALVNDPNKGKHESDYVMQEGGSLDPDLWNEA